MVRFLVIIMAIMRIQFLPGLFGLLCAMVLTILAIVLLMSPTANGSSFDYDLALDEQEHKEMDANTTISFQTELTNHGDNRQFQLEITNALDLREKNINATFDDKDNERVFLNTHYIAMNQTVIIIIYINASEEAISGYSRVVVKANDMDNEEIIFLIFSVSINENTIIVAKDGSGDYTSIQEAIDNATEGDIIRVWEGTYYENVVVNKTVSLIGNGSEVTAINGSGDDGDVVTFTADWVNMSGFEIAESGESNVGILIKSNYNTINNNSLNNNGEYGIHIHFSESNSLTDNKMVGEGIYIAGSMLKTWNTHHIDTTNTINGKPVQYYKNVNGITVPSGAGQVILANSSHMVVENQNLSDGSASILVGYSSNIILSNNTCFNQSGFCVVLQHSFTNIINNITCSNTGRTGIYLRHSSSNTLNDNICLNNSFSGISLYFSDNNSLTNNTFSNNQYGIYLLDSNTNAILNNTCTNNQYGISLGFSNDNILISNSCLNNRHGIRLSKSNNNTINNNTCTNNHYGIYLVVSNYNTVENNTCSDNKYGVFIKDSHNNIISNNIFLDNSEDDIRYDRKPANDEIEADEDDTSLIALLIIASAGVFAVVAFQSGYERENRMKERARIARETDQKKMMRKETVKSQVDFEDHNRWKPEK